MYIYSPMKRYAFFLDCIMIIIIISLKQNVLENISLIEMNCK